MDYSKLVMKIVSRGCLACLGAYNVASLLLSIANAYKRSKEANEANEARDQMYEKTIDILREHIDTLAKENEQLKAELSSRDCSDA